MSYSYVVIPYNVVCKSVKMIRVDFHESSLPPSTELFPNPGIEIDIAIIIVIVVICEGNEM